MGVIVGGAPSVVRNKLERRGPPLLLAVSALLREIVRAPMVYWLMLTRQRAELATVLPVLGLPETLHANIISLCGLVTSLRLSLSCRLVYAQLWENPIFWRSLLPILGLHTVDQPRGGHLACTGPPTSAQALRCMARRSLLGIDLLTSLPVDPCNSHISAPARARCRSISLKDARRAVLALRDEDDPSLIQRATESISALLRWRASGESEHQDGEALLEAVSSRAGLFDTGQMLDMLGAHQQASIEECDFHVASQKLQQEVPYSTSTRRRSGINRQSPRCRSSFHALPPESMYELRAA